MNNNAKYNLQKQVTVLQSDVLHLQNLIQLTEQEGNKKAEDRRVEDIARLK